MLDSLTDRLSGHAWTIGPKLRDLTNPAEPPPSIGWHRRVDRLDDRPVHVTGRYRHRGDSKTLAILVHGLGGCADSGYVLRAARALDELGIATLRLSMRGADRSGEDIYHGGLTDDINAALTDPALAGYDRRFVIGFSLGGHIALRTAIDATDDRLTAAAAICSPLDLGAAQRGIDRPGQFVYREYLLRELRDGYRGLAERGAAPTPAERVARVRSLREWDALTVVPRFGFGDVDDYYRRASVAGDLGGLDRPALLVAARHDPMIGPSAIESGLSSASYRLTVRWSERGGHVFFPEKLDLGFGPRTGLIPQIMAWFERQTG
jgi:hypothetical protein